MNLASVKAIQIPEGTVKEISCNGVVLWTGQPSPVVYQDVEYIESTGTQYIDTGVIGDEQSGFEMKLYSNNTFSTSGYGTMFGARMSSGSRQFVLSSYGTSSGGGQVRWGNSTTNNIYMAKQRVDTVSLRGTTLTRPNGTTVTLTRPSAFTTPSSLTVFALNENGNKIQYGSLRLYYLKLYDGNTLIRDFVPCYRKSDSVAGLYDTVNSQFYTNGGTGSFTVGPDVN